jgi:2-C-methyl-D-erythritol 4-phosphate cytidylyltransferase
LNAGITTTDDAELVERIGATVAIVAGSSMNLKITTLDDLHIAEAIVAAKVISGPS